MIKKLRLLLQTLANRIPVNGRHHITLDVKGNILIVLMCDGKRLECSLSDRSIALLRRAEDSDAMDDVIDNLIVSKETG